MAPWPKIISVRVRMLAPSTVMAMGVAILVVANDFTALSVALPAIEKTFNTDVTTVQWVINGYAMVFGVAIVTGGRLADMFGRRRIFFIGAAIVLSPLLPGKNDQQRTQGDEDKSPEVAL